MALHVCSLKFDADRDGGPRSVAPGESYHLVPFPYGSAENYDADNMHAEKRGGTSHPFPDQASALIWPAHKAWGRLYAMIQWEAASGGVASEFRDQFARDPLGKVDTTCTEHRRASPGMQCFAKSWAIFVDPEVPLGLRVAHNASGSLHVVLAEFKLEYEA
jgi:hypothetical protein